MIRLCIEMFVFVYIQCI